MSETDALTPPERSGSLSEADAAPLDPAAARFAAVAEENPMLFRLAVG